jgi:PRC-barrel domain protein
MRQAFALYAALKIEHDLRERGPQRCCTDEPPAWALQEARRERPVAVTRWVRKLGTAIPATAAAFLGAFRQPVGRRAPAVGSRVVTANGQPVGRILDVMVGLNSRRTDYAIAPDGADRDRVLLLPRGALRPGGRPDVFILDRDRDLRRQDAA